MSIYRTTRWHRGLVNCLLAGFIIGLLTSCVFDDNPGKKNTIEEGPFKVEVKGDMPSTLRGQTAQFTVSQGEGLAIGERRLSFSAHSEGSSRLSDTGMHLFLPTNGPIEGNYILKENSQMVFQFGDSNVTAYNGTISVTMKNGAISGTFDVSGKIENEDEDEINEGRNDSERLSFKGSFNGPYESVCKVISIPGGVPPENQEKVLVVDEKQTSEFCRMALKQER